MLRLLVVVNALLIFMSASAVEHGMIGWLQAIGRMMFFAFMTCYFHKLNEKLTKLKRQKNKSHQR